MKLFTSLCVVLSLTTLLKVEACGPGEQTPTPTPFPTPPEPSEVPPPPGHGPLCTSSADCSSGEACRGQANVEGEPQPMTGCCTSTAAIPGSGGLCQPDGTCGEGLACIGGYCSPEWMVGEFSHAVSQGIPDGGTLTDNMMVHCLATVAVDVTLDLEIRHPRMSDLTITFYDVSKSISTVIPTQGVTSDTLKLVGLEVNHSGDEYVNGDWPLVIQDAVPGEQGTLVGWTLHVTSRWD